MKRERKRPDWPIKVYRYGLQLFDKIPEPIFDEARKQNNLWNKLVELHKANQKEYDGLLRAADPAYIEAAAQQMLLWQEKNIAWEAMQKAKVTFRTRDEDNPKLKPFVEDWKARKKVAQEYFKNEFKKAKVAAKKKTSEDALRQLKTKFSKEVTEAVKLSNVYWADADDIKGRFFTAISKGKAKFHAFDRADSMSFRHRFTGGGLPITNIYDSKAKRLSVSSVDYTAYGDYLHKVCSQREMKKRVRSEINTTLAGSVPVHFYAVLHRPIPDSAILKQAIFKREHIGGRNRWTLSLQVEEPPETASIRAKANGKAGIDINWRVLNGRVRFAVLASGNNHCKEFYLPDKLLVESRECDKLMSRKDNLFEDAKRLVIEHIDTLLVPDELKQGIFLARQKRLYAIVRQLEGEQSDMALTLKQWRDEDKRLVDRVSWLRRKMRDHKQWFFYNVAHDFCKRFDTVVLEGMKMNLAKMARKKPTKSKESLPEAASFYRHLAGVGAFRQTVKYVAGKRGICIIEEDPKHTTMKCNQCGHINRPKAKSRQKLVWTCTNCKAEWDQDHNAAINLRKSAFANKTAVVAD